MARGHRPFLSRRTGCCCCCCFYDSFVPARSDPKFQQQPSTHDVCYIAVVGGAQSDWIGGRPRSPSWLSSWDSTRKRETSYSVIFSLLLAVSETCLTGGCCTVRSSPSLVGDHPSFVIQSSSCRSYWTAGNRTRKPPHIQKKPVDKKTKQKQKQHQPSRIVILIALYKTQPKRHRTNDTVAPLEIFKKKNNRWITKRTMANQRDESKKNGGKSCESICNVRINAKVFDSIILRECRAMDVIDTSV